ncbi:MAG TPA: GH25 family lysozyme [Gaiellaceae bacterium]|nr:GH25 family lysozyme [Gaiellaceae bacterium]
MRRGAVSLSRYGLASLLALSLAAGASAQSAPTGIDVSHYQGTIDWVGVAGAGVDFAFVKATEGSTLTDVTYPLNRQGAGAVGVPIGAYHFARPSGTTDAAVVASAIAQADAFVAFAQPAAGDLLPALDLEKTGNLSAARLTAWTQAWLDEVGARLGVRPIVYASPAFWRKYLGDTPIFALDGDALWIAHWTSAALPILPGGGWGGLGWTFWQWSDCQHVKGIARCVDGDRFNGTALAAETIRPFPSGLPVASERPTVVGTPQAGKLLAALPGGWEGGKPVSFSYQWQACDAAGGGCLPIPGATGETYTPVAADVGHALVATVTAQTGSGAASASSAPTLAVASSPTPTPSAAPTPISLPTIAGTPQVGQVLTGQVGTWKGAPTSFSYQWRRCDATGIVCTAITGAGATTYTVTPGDVGAVLSLVVTATGRGGSRSATAAGTAAVAPAPVPAAVVGSLVAQPGQAGAVTVAGGGVTATWQPGAVTAGSTVTLAAGPSKLAVPGSALSLGVGGPGPLPFPIDVRYAAAAPDAVPGFIAISGVWQPVAPLAGPSLPDGQDTGAYRDAAGALHVLTRLPGRIALFAAGKWGDPRFVSSRRPSLTVVNDVTVARHDDGSALIRARITLDTQAHLYVGVLTPHGQALVPQHGNRVGWWLQGQPTKTIQTLQLRPGAFPIRLLVPAGQLKARGRYALRLAALDPYGRRVHLVLPIPQLGSSS